MTTTASTKLTTEFMDSLGQTIADNLLRSWSGELRKELYEQKLEYLLDDDVLESLSEEQFDQLEEYYCSDETLSKFKFTSHYNK